LSLLLNYTLGIGLLIQIMISFEAQMHLFRQNKLILYWALLWSLHVEQTKLFESLCSRTSSNRHNYLCDGRISTERYGLSIADTSYMHLLPKWDYLSDQASIGPARATPTIEIARALY
jgi:hypothetical protein